VEPEWTRDGTHIVFRSDRDAVSNLYAYRLADGALLRVTNVLGGAFTPDPSPDGRQVVFASYGSHGYDLHVADLDLASLPPAEPFLDPYPDPRAGAPPVETTDEPYRPFPTLLPRFWTPYASRSSGRWRVGAATAGADPLLRHLYGLDVYWKSDTDRGGAQAYYQYDRFRPTFVITGEDTQGRVRSRGGQAMVHSREVVVRASLPLVRRWRRSQAVSLSWRRQRDTSEDPEGVGGDLGGLEAAWSLNTARRHPYSISPVEGFGVRLAFLKEDPALGSDVSLAKALVDARVYHRAFGENDALALRIGGGFTLGRPSFRRSFAVGGFPEGSLLDVVRTNQSVLRGYPDDAFTGRRFLHGNLEYRFPLAHPQRGFRSLPFFVRHLHAAVFADAAHAWSGGFRLDDVRTAFGAALGADVQVGHGLPLTGTAGIARGLADQGETRFYFRAGLAF